ncbi:ATP-grasp domain-containing protein [Turneriella parva]|uniref:ATP-grasp domain-containing protein n=1 Tax=Turneriella parva TaxID=29510 RepID=UPI0003144616|nr:ATP-grasp domain-containing protein [Turneriella parva]
MAKAERDGFYLSLGAGENQLPLIRAARDQGLKIIGVDRNLGAVGLKLCDLKIEESILNYRKIYYKISSLVEPSQIAGGYAASYGEALASFAFLCERLSIIGLSRTLMETVLDKLQVRKRLLGLEHSNFAQPNFLEISQSMHREEIEQLGFPLIAKTRRGASKKHIYRLENWLEVKNFLSRRNLEALGVKGHEFIFEQFIEGDEIIVTGFAQNFHYQLLSVHDRIAATRPPYIDLEHRFPSRYAHLAASIQQIHEQICMRLQLSDTPIVSEWKVVADRIYLVELSAQIPGEHVADFMIPKGLRYDYFANLVRLTLGEKIEPVSEKHLHPVRVRYWAENPGWGEWQEETRKASFARVINANPPKTITSNLDRYGVAGFLD